VSLESAKKYGFIASVLQVVLPIVTLVTLGVFFYQLFYQIFSGNGQVFPSFWNGVFIGVTIVTSAAGIIGLILFFLSMHKLSNIYKEPKIFKNILYGFLASIVAGIIICVLIVVFILVVPTFSSVTTFPDSSIAPAAVMSFSGILVTAIGGTVVFSIIIGVFYWKAFTKLGEKSGVGAFETVGVLYLVGSILIVAGIGIIVLWIAWILAADAYRKLQPQQTTTNCTSTFAI
jgi:uncharacterized membrane protein